MVKRRAKVLVIGVDAADSDLLQRWAAEGRLPVFRSLFERAAWGPTTNPRGLFVGAVWPSFSTGVSPARHGRHCYSQLRPGTYETVRFRPENLKAPPFWNALSRANRRVAIVDVPKTNPIQDLNGIQLCDWGTHDPEGECRSWPRELASQIEARFGNDPLGKCDAAGRGIAEFEELRERLLSRVKRKSEIAESLLERGEWDLFAAVFSESHCVGHQCWHLHDPSHPRHDAAVRQALGDPILDIYTAIDGEIGRLLDRFDEQTSVFILASHGMGPHYDGTFLLEEILRRVQDAPLSAARRGTGNALAWVWDRVPAALRDLSAPVRGRLRRRLGEALPTIEMLGSRKCFPVLNNDVCGGIRLNLVGREPLGRLRAGADAEAFCDELIGHLRELTCSDSGLPLVRDVLRTADLYEGEHLGDLPDLLVEWHRERPITSIESPRIGRIDGEYRGTRSGDHKAPGLFFAYGPEIRPGRLEESVSIMDFAPTIAGLLGVPLPQTDGRSIEALLSGSSIRQSAR